ncbi:GNAT family N-acetyltransferase [Pseudaeromonas paramecii]|uniref:Ribosomal protein S5-alanine N-acetyltransferase n=1 Tax=Pseudaeromonas paramecii TaxID=2138166 RepID=A0ABP8Q857_9GAMM
MIIHTHRTRLEILSPQEAQLMLDYQLANRDHLAPWEPQRPADYYQLSYWQQQLAAWADAFIAGREYHFVALTPDRQRVLGLCQFTGLQHGAFEACYLGYSIAKDHEGQGLMREIVQAAIGYLFEETSLQRIMANYMPSNGRSGRLLRRLGFEREGYARRYLKIAGHWQDHLLTALLRDEA